MAKLTNLVRDCNEVLSRIEAYCANGRGHHRSKTALLRDFVYTTALFHQTPAALKRTIRYSWDRFDRQYAERSGRLAVALLLHLGRRMSLRRAKAFTSVPISELTYALRLIRSTVGEFAALRILEDHEAIRASADGYLEQMTVVMEPRALEDLLLAAAETYVVPSRGKGKGYTECYGICFGSRRDYPPLSSGRFRRTVHVSRVVTQLRARANAHEVYPNPLSAKIHGEVADRLFGHLAVVGDYHTHPYGSLKQMRAATGWLYSSQDERHIAGWIDEQRALGQDPRFSLVVAVARGARKGSYVRAARNRVRICVGRVFLEVAAYRMLPDRKYDDAVQLEVPSAGMGLTQ